MRLLLSFGISSFALCLSLWLVSLWMHSFLERNRAPTSKSVFLRNQKSSPRKMLEITPSSSSILLLFRLKYVNNSTATSLESRKIDDKAVISICQAVYEQVRFMLFFPILIIREKCVVHNLCLGWWYGS
jgi:hypothetical protein